MRYLINLFYKGAQTIKRIFLFHFCSEIFKIILWMNYVNFGNNIRTYNSFPKLVINRKSKSVRIGNNFTVNNYTGHSWYCRSKIYVSKDAELIIGDNSGMNGTLIFCSLSIYIGNNVKIGGGTRICDTNFHSLDYLERRGQMDKINESKAPIVIENDVFIGANSYIGKGLTIGDRSIIAAGSVVVKSIPSDEIWGGNPAKFIRKCNS